MEVFMLFLLLLVMSCKSTESKSSLTLYRAALNYEMNDLKFNKIRSTKLFEILSKTDTRYQTIGDYILTNKHNEKN